MPFGVEPVGRPSTAFGFARTTSAIRAATARASVVWSLWRTTGIFAGSALMPLRNTNGVRARFVAAAFRLRGPEYMAIPVQQCRPQEAQAKAVRQRAGL